MVSNAPETKNATFTYIVTMQSLKRYFDRNIATDEPKTYIDYLVIVDAFSILSCSLARQFTLSLHRIVCLILLS